MFKTKQMKNFLVIIHLLLLQYLAVAQINKNTELYKTISSKDSLLFNIGFNNCDIKQFEYLLGDDFEFYHDKDGFSDKNKFINDLKKGYAEI